MLSEQVVLILEMKWLSSLGSGVVKNYIEILHYPIAQKKWQFFVFGTLA